MESDGQFPRHRHARQRERSAFPRGKEKLVRAFAKMWNKVMNPDRHELLSRNDGMRRNLGAAWAHAQ